MTWIKGAHPVIKGKTSLDGPEEWQTVTDENKAAMRYCAAGDDEAVNRQNVDL